MPKKIKKSWHGHQIRSRSWSLCKTGRSRIRWSWKILKNLDLFSLLILDKWGIKLKIYRLWHKYQIGNVTILCDQYYMSMRCHKFISTLYWYQLFLIFPVVSYQQIPPLYSPPILALYIFLLLLHLLIVIQWLFHLYGYPLHYYWSVIPHCSSIALVFELSPFFYILV